MFVSLDLPDPNVTLSTAIGVAGEVIELICTVTTVEYLSESAILSVTWSGDGVASSGVTQSETSSISEIDSMSTLMFSPLSTSHGAEYSCQAVIDIRALNITKTGVDSADLIVQSENAMPSVNIYSSLCFYPQFLVPLWWCMHQGKSWWLGPLSPSPAPSLLSLWILPPQ